jgi:shikimate kinase
MNLQAKKSHTGNVYLVGPMGSGKTTLGRRAAVLLGLEFIDCDQEIERRTGATVNLIFDIEGEPGFRDRETALLGELSEQSGRLIATGGGAVLREENRELMRNSGFVVWLRTSVEHQIARLGRDRSRPLLQTPDREKLLHQLAAERDPLYTGMADLVFDSSHRNVKRVAEELCREIRQCWPSPVEE